MDEGGERETGPGKGGGGRKGGRVMQQEGERHFGVCGRVRREGEEAEQHGAIRAATKKQTT